MLTSSAHSKVTHKKYYILYTILFAVAFIFIFSGYLINGKSFVFCDTHGGGDGLVQHFNSFVYYGKYLRRIIRNLFLYKTIMIPEWDMSLGFGQDIVTTLSYYVIGDPFSALSVFCPAKYAEYLYSALIILRIYLAGITFSIYARHHGYRSVLTLCGTMIYVFSAYTLLASTLHPYFTNPLVYLPLLLLGIDRVFEKKGPGAYTAMITLSALTNFYFFYMLCLIIVIYVVFRFFYTVRSHYISELVKYFFIFLVLSLLGIGMAMVLFLPTLQGILGSNRIGAEIILHTFYDGQYYLNFIGAFLSGSAGYYTHLGYTGIGLTSVIVLFMNLGKGERKNRFMAAGFLLLTAFLLLPFFGHLFNGMSYVTNRWVWAYAFAVSMIVVMMIPKMSNLTNKELLAVSAAAFFYVVVIFSVQMLRNEKNIAAAACLFMFVTALFGAPRMKESIPFKPLFLGVTIISLIVNALYINQISNNDYIKRFTERGHALHSLLNDSPGYPVSKIADNTLFRYDSGGFSTDSVRRNSAMLLDLNSCSYYYSTTNEYVSQFFRSICLNTPMEQTYNDLNSRYILDSLLGVKYFVVKDGNESYLPCGYTNVVAEKGSRKVYENKSALPIVFTASDYVPEKEYEALTALEKQQLLAQTIVLGNSAHIEKAKYTLSKNELNYEMSSSDNAEINENQIIVKNEDAAVTFHFQASANTEYYIVFEGLNYSETDTSAFGKAIDTLNIKVATDHVSHNVKYLTPDSPYYNDIHSFICNTGIMKEGDQTITVTFPKAGIYAFDTFGLRSQQVDTIGSSMRVFCEDDTSNFQEILNGIEGSLTVDKAKMLCISVPYSENWKAYVDGAEAEIEVVDQFMTGVNLRPGTHTVRLLYHNRNLSKGLLLSMISMVVFIIMESSLLIYRRKRVS